MVRALSEKDTDQNSQISEKIKASARQIWLAGLGAYNKAEEDAGKIFDRLVKEGEELEHTTRDVVEKRFKAVEEQVGEVKDKASGTLGKLESVFDQRVSAALSRLGIPSKHELDELKSKVAALEKALKKTD